MPMEEITIWVDNIDGAAEKIIAFIEGTTKGDVIYFNGWNGLGASAVLKAVVKRLRSSSSRSATRKAPGLDKIIHIDCSLWQSKRALQKAIAEELRLSQHVMAFFDQHDEEDDFDGVDQGSRGVIPHVTEAIFSDLANCRFLVVFHNGSGGYIDLWECGVPARGFMSKRVLWTSQGRLHLHGIQAKDVKKAAGLSDVAISADIRGDDVMFSYSMRRLLHAEAKEVAGYTGVPEPGMSPKIVLDCFLYKALRADEYGIDWAFHAPNYWVCDGIIQATINGGRSAWEIADALWRSMNLDWHQGLVERLCEIFLRGKQWSHIYRWASATRQKEAPAQLLTSFFWTAAGPTVNNILEASMFGHSDRTNLRVIHLSHCTFSFSLPPFLSCSNLRFLLLDHCKDKDVANPSGGEDYHRKNNHASMPCFKKLWVLELSYTDWYCLLSEEMMDLMADLRELNVKGASNWAVSHLHRYSSSRSNSYRLLKLRVIGKPDDTIGIGGDRNQASPVVKYLDLSCWRILKTIILDGCIELEQVGINALPPMLESFSFVSNDAPAKITSISLQGCTQLRNLLLRGLLRSLKELDMSGTAVETLNLSAVEAPYLKRLFLMGCEKLCAIIWPREEMNKPELEVLQIDTTHAAWDNKEDTSKKQEEATIHNTLVWSSSATVHANRWALTDKNSSHISLRDARLFQSLQNATLAKALHVEISTAGADVAPAGHRITNHQETNGSKGCSEQVRTDVSLLQRPASSNLYVDDVFAATFRDSSLSGGASGGVIGAPAVITWTWNNCPPIPTRFDWVNCYISIQDEAQTGLLKSTTSNTKRENVAKTTLPSFVAHNARTLHLHDSLSITCILGPAPAAAVDLGWRQLRWCRLERCPNLQGTVFTAPSLRHDRDFIFWYLTTFWASQLQEARYIWGWTASRFRPGGCSFEFLVFLHLDYCPRLVHVLPLYTSNSHGCHSLETLEIVCCSDLMEVFPLESESQQQKSREFPKLKHIHLYELPMLQRICGRRMFMPKLEIVKIRGCWGLNSLPAVRRPSVNGSTSQPKVDCEKDWWDGLEWDGLEAGHHPSLYKAVHSAYYKKNLRRTTVLR